MIQQQQINKFQTYLDQIGRISDHFFYTKQK